MFRNFLPYIVLIAGIAACTGCKKDKLELEPTIWDLQGEHSFGFDTIMYDPYAELFYGYMNIDWHSLPDSGKIVGAAVYISNYGLHFVNKKNGLFYHQRPRRFTTYDLRLYFYGIGGLSDHPYADTTFRID